MSVLRRQNQLFSLLTQLHGCTGQLLQWFARVLLVACLTGMSFTTMAVGLAQLINDPLAVFHAQSLLVNRSELSSFLPKTEKDTNWDGAFTGMSLGASLTQSIPLAGAPIGGLFGALIGYELDREI